MRNRRGGCSLCKCSQHLIRPDSSKSLAMVTTKQLQKQFLPASWQIMFIGFSYIRWQLLTWVHGGCHVVRASTWEVGLKTWWNITMFDFSVKGINSMMLKTRSRFSSSTHELLQGAHRKTVSADGMCTVLFSPLQMWSYTKDPYLEASSSSLGKKTGDKWQRFMSNFPASVLPWCSRCDKSSVLFSASASSVLWICFSLHTI